MRQYPLNIEKQRLSTVFAIGFRNMYMGYGDFGSIGKW